MRTFALSQTVQCRSLAGGTIRYCVADQLANRRRPVAAGATHLRRFRRARQFVGGFRCIGLAAAGSKQHALLDYRHALLAAPPEQPVRQQLHPLA